MGVQMSMKSKVEFTDPSEMNSIESVQNICRYVFSSKFVEEKVVLDLASGAGHGSYHLINEGAKKVVGVDYSLLSIEYSKKQYESDNLTFLQANAVSLPFKNEYFDVIVSFETIEHIEEYKKFLSECKRCLKKGGLLIISTPNRQLSPIIRPKEWNHYHEFIPEEFFSLLREYFDDVEPLCQSFVNPVLHMVKAEIIIISGRILGKKIRLMGSLIRRIRNSNQNKTKTNGFNEVPCNTEIKSYKRKFLNIPLYLVAIAKK